MGHTVEGDGSGAANDVTVIADAAIPPSCLVCCDGLAWKDVTVLIGFLAYDHKISLQWIF